MASKNWLWIVIACLLVIAVYKVGKFAGESKELAFQKEKEETRKAEFAKLLSLREQEKREAERRREQEKYKAEREKLTKELRESQERQNQISMDMLMAQSKFQQQQSEIASRPPPSTALMLDYLLSRNSNNLSSSIERYPLSSYTSKTPQRGLISGIVSSEDSFCALIGSEVVREGDIIDGIKIVKIHKDKVEFEKNGKRWTQALNETPGSEWQ